MSLYDFTWLINISGLDLCLISACMLCRAEIEGEAYNYYRAFYIRRMHISPHPLRLGTRPRYMPARNASYSAYYPILDECREERGL